MFVSILLNVKSTDIRIKMALVADYSDSGDDTDHEEEEAGPPKAADVVPVVKAAGGVNGSAGGDDDDAVPHISDDEDEGWAVSAEEPGSVLNDQVEDIPGLSSSRSMFAGLAAASSSTARPSTSSGGGAFADADEDTSDLPRASRAELEAAPLKPKAAPTASSSALPRLGAAKRGRGKGPVRIVLPSLSQLEEQDDEDGEGPGMNE